MAKTHLSGLHVVPSSSDVGAPETNDFRVGVGGAAVKAIMLVSVNQDVGAIPADGTLAVNFTVSGVAVGDAVVLIPPSTLPADVLIHTPTVTAANTVKVEFENETAAAIDPAAMTYQFLVFDLT